MAKLYSVNLYKRVVDYDGGVEEFIEDEIVVKRSLFSVKDIFGRNKYPILNDTNERDDYEMISGSDYSSYEMAQEEAFQDFERYCGYCSEDEDYEFYFVKKSDLTSRNELDKYDIENLLTKVNPPRELQRAYTKARKRQWR